MSDIAKPEALLHTDCGSESELACPWLLIATPGVPKHQHSHRSAQGRHLICFVILSKEASIRVLRP